jgi:hypothetical protein
MKKVFFVLFLFSAAAAFGQVGASLSSQPVVLELPDHPQHAAPHGMASEQPLVGGGPETYTVAHGEVPLWEFGPVTEEPSLGDVARAYRKEKLAAKKAEIVLEKQGS